MVLYCFYKARYLNLFSIMSTRTNNDVLPNSISEQRIAAYLASYCSMFGTYFGMLSTILLHILHHNTQCLLSILRHLGTMLQYVYHIAAYFAPYCCIIWLEIAVCLAPYCSMLGTVLQHGEHRYQCC